MSSSDEYVFELEPNEEYSERCGEVFLTNVGYLVFHCTLCDDVKFKGFKRFADHVREEHLLSSNHSDSFLDSELAARNGYEEIKMKGEDDMEEIFDVDGIESTVTEVSLITNDIFSNGESKKFKKDPLNQNIVLVNNTQFCSEETKDEIIPEIREVRQLNRYKNSQEERKHICSICGASFREMHNLNNHVLRHSNEKKFPCLQCEKKFFTAAECRGHMRFHGQDRQLVCTKCGMTFATNVLLSKHMTHHKNSQSNSSS